MHNSRTLSLSLFLSLTLLALAAEAQQRVFVSAAQGDDGNICSVAAPCRSFAHAITVVSAGGEILVLDSGGYGPVTITQSVSIVSPLGVEGSITQTASNGNAILVNAPGHDVSLRGLSLFGGGTGEFGIYIVNATTVSVEQCSINAFGSVGIFFNVSALSTLTVSNCTIAHNLLFGIDTGASANNLAQFEIDHTHLEANVSGGLACYEGSRGIIRDSYVSGSQFGVSAQNEGVAGRTSILEVDSCTLTFNTVYAVQAANNGGAFAVIRVSNSVVSLNQTAINALDANAHVYTRLNNTMANNGSDGAFTDTFAAQ